MSYRDELDAWRRAKAATKRILAEIECDEHGWPLPKPKEEDK